MASECHAVEVVSCDFDTTCRVMMTHGAAILNSASRRAATHF